MKDEIGKRLREMRLNMGWSQDELAQKTGLKLTAISHFECGRRSPCCSNLVKLSKALKCSTDEILGINY